MICLKGGNKQYTVTNNCTHKHKMHTLFCIILPVTVFEKKKVQKTK